MTTDALNLIERLKPEGCTCSWAIGEESLAGEPTHYLIAGPWNRRCRVHGKPRHAKNRSVTP